MSTSLLLYKHTFENGRVLGAAVPGWQGAPLGWAALSMHCQHLVGSMMASRMSHSFVCSARPFWPERFAVLRRTPFPLSRSGAEGNVRGEAVNTTAFRGDAEKP